MEKFVIFIPYTLALVERIHENLHVETIKSAHNYRLNDYELVRSVFVFR